MGLAVAGLKQDQIADRTRRLASGDWSGFPPAHQAAFAFERWTGAQAPLAAMREALQAGLAEADEARRTP